ncbi:MAG: DUF4160 domain-containing protein [Saprospiraceae bacterium]|jgi:hypothetical protein|nr:DUF4160 domain-containing protein [Saprospiraceae bacterium]
MKELELLNLKLNTLFHAIEIDINGNIYAERQQVGKINNLKLYIYSNDHNPPHFHVKSPNFDAYFDLKSCDLLKGTIDSKNHTKIRYLHKSLADDMYSVWEKLNPR